MLGRAARLGRGTARVHRAGYLAPHLRAPLVLTVSKWKGKRVVLSLIDLPEVVLNNGAGKVSGEAWKADLRDIIDEDGDGIEVEEIKAFIEQDPMLCKD
eukprot:scaffold11188_cov104-Isochrysis_galbana.AAC.2